MVGDNILTALSVGRQCGMVGRKDRVILLKAQPPDGDEVAKISWELADTEICVDTNTTDLEGVRCHSFSTYLQPYFLH